MPSSVDTAVMVGAAAREPMCIKVSEIALLYCGSHIKCRLLNHADVSIHFIFLHAVCIPFGVLSTTVSFYKSLRLFRV